MLPVEKEVRLFEDNFPTKWQTVIFRNYGFVPAERIASVLNWNNNKGLNKNEKISISSFADRY